jgi:hypothetical protein
MKVKWISGDTPGRIEYLDYHSIQQALQADPGCLEIIYGFGNPGAPGTPADEAEA